jgi:Acetyltransferase (GNAT) domain
VPTSGVAGVVVTPELRGTGLARKLLTTLLAAARDRGAVISTLFNTVAAPSAPTAWSRKPAPHDGAWVVEPHGLGVGGHGHPQAGEVGFVVVVPPVVGDDGFVPQPAGAELVDDERVR